MSSRWETLSTVLVAVCALVVTSLFVMDHVRGPSNTGERVDAKLEAVNPDLVLRIDSVALGHWHSEGAARLTEFIDVECPFCASFAKRLDSAKAVLGDSLDVRYVNFPLSIHRFARSGAKAVDCAFGAGRGDEFVREVFKTQDSLGFWTWERYAVAAGIRDTATFSRCRSSREVESRLGRTLEVVEQLDLRGTPAVLLRGQRYDRPPALEQLISDVRRPAARGR